VTLTIQLGGQVVIPDAELFRRLQPSRHAKCARFFDGALYFIRPEGAGQNSPGQRPGWRLRNLRRSPVRATHRRSAVAPLQGFFPRFSRFFASPGHCPGLICPAPSGPKPQTARHQNAYAGSSRLHDRPNWSDYGVPFLEASQGTFSKYALLSDAATAICLSSGLQASP
jgi:hypothetical protein